MAAMCGPRFRLDHIYLDVIKPPLPVIQLHSMLVGPLWQLAAAASE